MAAMRQVSEARRSQGERSTRLNRSPTTSTTTIAASHNKGRSETNSTTSAYLPPVVENGFGDESHNRENRKPSGWRPPATECTVVFVRSRGSVQQGLIRRKETGADHMLAGLVLERIEPQPVDAAKPWTNYFNWGRIGVAWFADFGDTTLVTVSSRPAGIGTTSPGDTRRPMRLSRPAR